MSKRILGLDLGSNSIGWALLKTTDAGKPTGLIDLGSRIFNKAVEDKTPTPKNQKRRNSRLARRVVQRRARRRQRMLNYLVSLNLLPASLKDHPKPESVLNALGDPYSLRAKALDSPLSVHELGRVLLHLVQRRGFLSNRKTRLGREMLDDPDVQAVLAELEEDTTGGDRDRTDEEKEENAFKQDISQLRKTIEASGCRTLGEYLASLKPSQSKRNRQRDGGHLRTDRQMYQEELDAIWEEQKKHHTVLTDKVKEQIEQIIFHQRPLKLQADRVGKCSLEPRCTRARIARLEYQQFRYLQDINNLQFFDPYTETWSALSDENRATLVTLFESTPTLTFPGLRRALGLARTTEFNLEKSEVKKLKGNTTACKIRKVLPEWDAFSQDKQYALVEDLLTIQKKSVLKKRLIGHWQFDSATAVNLCMVEFEPGHGNFSTKAVRKLLPYLEQGEILSEARVEAGYGYEQEAITAKDRLGPPPTIANPIVQKGLHEIRRVVNAIIAEYGKPDAVRIEMARDLEMNTKRYAARLKQQRANTKANEEAAQKYAEMRQKNPHLGLSENSSRNDKMKYRLWKDQEEKCVYSGRQIIVSELFGPAVEIDHILPYSLTLDDSYMNKVICYTEENRDKRNRTPMDAFGSNEDKWNQITQTISRWGKSLKSKRERFYKREADLQERDFINSQLTDTRYISREASRYLSTLGVEVTFPKAAFTGWLRRQWGLNSLIGTTDEKERTDHRHHAVDATVIACVDRGFHQRLVRLAKKLERSHSELNLRDISIDIPWQTFRQDVHDQLQSLIVSHVPQRKISGALHEETGVGFIAGNGVDGPGTVYRQALDTDFKVTQIDKIVDPVIREQVRKHLANNGNDPKQAFADGKGVVHKNGKTPIKRVRVRQSKVPDLDTLKKTKFGVRDRQGKVFKWMAYGNTHHVEIIRHRKTEKYEGRFVTAIEAAHRARGINGSKRLVIQTDHGEAYEFVMALHINDLVSTEADGKTEFYRVQKFEQDGSRLELRLHTAATLENKEEGLRKSISTLMKDYSLQKHLVNAIGKLRNDKTDHRH